jgi:hypothetical protein
MLGLVVKAPRKLLAEADGARARVQISLSGERRVVEAPVSARRWRRRLESDKLNGRRYGAQPSLALIWHLAARPEKIESKSSSQPMTDPLDTADRSEPAADGGASAKPAPKNPLHGNSAASHAMIRAASRGDATKVAHLLAEGADPSQLDKSKKCALDHAIEAKSAECLRLLAPVSNLERIRGGGLPLSRVASVGWAEGVEILLPHADPKHTNTDGTSALMCAARAGCAEAVRLLLPVSDPKHKNDTEKTALVHAVIGRSLECVRLLLPPTNATPKEKGGIALAMALDTAVAIVSPQAIEIAQAIHGVMEEGWRKDVLARAALRHSGPFSSGNDESLIWAIEGADWDLAQKTDRAAEELLDTLSVSAKRRAVLDVFLMNRWFDEKKGQRVLFDVVEGLQQRDFKRETEIAATADAMALRLAPGGALAAKLLEDTKKDLPQLRAREEALALRAEVAASSKSGAQGEPVGAAATKGAPRL